MEFGDITISQDVKPDRNKKQEEESITKRISKLKKDIEGLSSRLEGIKKENIEKISTQKKPEKNISRRKFLKISGIGAVALLLAGTDLVGEFGKDNKNRTTNKSKKPLPDEEFKKGEKEIDNKQKQEVIKRDNLEDLTANYEFSILNTFQKAYDIIFKNENNRGKEPVRYSWVPREIFNDIFFLAMEMKESHGDASKVSESDAYGVMQMKKIAIQDVNEYLKYLQRKKILVSLNIPNQISEEEMDRIYNYLQRSPDAGRMLGRLHLTNYFNKARGLDGSRGIGQTEYKRGDVVKAQKHLLVCYIAGSGQGIEFLKESDDSKWFGTIGKKTRRYYKEVFDYMKLIKVIRSLLQKNNLQEFDVKEVWIVLINKMEEFKGSSGLSPEKERARWLQKTLGVMVAHKEEIINQDRIVVSGNNSEKIGSLGLAKLKRVVGITGSPIILADNKKNRAG